MSDHSHSSSGSSSSQSHSSTLDNQSVTSAHRRIEQSLFRMKQRETAVMQSICTSMTQIRRARRRLRARKHPARNDPDFQYRTIFTGKILRTLGRSTGKFEMHRVVVVRTTWLKVPRRHQSIKMPAELTRIMMDHLLWTNTSTLLAAMRTCSAWYKIGWELLYKDCTVRSGGPPRSVKFPPEALPLTQRVRSLTYTNTDCNTYENERDSEELHHEVLDDTEQLFVEPSSFLRLSNLQYLSLTLWCRRSYHYDLFISLPSSLQGLDVCFPDMESAAPNSSGERLFDGFFAALPNILPHLQHLRFRAEYISNIVLASEPLPRLKTLIFNTIRHQFGTGDELDDSNLLFARHLQELHELNFFPNIMELRVISQQIRHYVHVPLMYQGFGSHYWKSFIVRDILSNTTTGSPYLVNNRNNIWIRTTRYSSLLDMADICAIAVEEDFVDLYTNHPSAQELLIQSIEGRGTWIRTARPRCSRFPISFRDTTGSDQIYSNEQQWNVTPSTIPSEFTVLNNIRLHEYTTQTRVILPFSIEGMHIVPQAQGAIWTAALTTEQLARQEVAMSRFGVEESINITSDLELEDELGFSASDMDHCWEDDIWLPDENPDEYESTRADSESEASEESDFSGTGSDWVRRYTTRPESEDFNLRWGSESGSESDSDSDSEGEPMSD